MDDRRRAIRETAGDRRARIGAVLLVLGLAPFGYLVGIGVAVPSAPLGDAEAGVGEPLLVSTQGDDGRVVSFTADGRERWRYHSDDPLFDLTQRANGSVQVSYGVVGSRDCRSFPAPCGRTGTRLLDPPATAAGTPSVVEDHGVEIRSKHNSEIHDAEPLPDGRVVYADMERERIVVAPHVGADPDWVWNASTLYNPPADPTKRDWLHINDVDRIAEGRYLVSVRNANQLLVLDRDEGVVEIINADRTDANDGECVRRGNWLVPNESGDVRCGDSTVMRAQHNPQWLGDGAVLVADSENNRIVELHRDDGRWRVAWADYGAGGVEYSWPRDADRLPDGRTVVSDTWNRRVVVLDRNGTLVGAVKTPPMVYEADVRGRELVGGPTVGDLGEPVDAPSGGDVPLLTSVLTALRHQFGVPWWFQERHIAFGILGLLAAAVGFGWVVGTLTDELGE